MINQSINSPIPLLNDIVNYFFTLKSKRLRPLMAIICTRLFSGNTKEIDIQLAAAIELLHTATLLHDDVVDNSFVRRFEKTVNSKWDNKASILVGDVLLSRSFSLILEAKSFNVLKSFNETINNLVDGEIENLNFQKTNTLISEEEYWQLVGKKTASLFSLACKIPALMYNQEETTTNLISEFGYLFGLMFQVTDDILDYKSENSLGKNCGDDFFEGKITLPIIFLIKAVDEDQREKLISLFLAKERSPIDLKFVQQLFIDFKIENKLSLKVLKLHNDILDKLERIKFKDNDIKNILVLIVEYCVNRIK